jgi:hypothetical protein
VSSSPRSRGRRRWIRRNSICGVGLCRVGRVGLCSVGGVAGVGSLCSVEGVVSLCSVGGVEGVGSVEGVGRVGSLWRWYRIATSRACGRPKTRG